MSETEFETRFPLATRIEIITDDGRIFVWKQSQAGMRIHIQDDHRTLKVFTSQPEPGGNQ